METKLDRVLTIVSLIGLVFIILSGFAFIFIFTFSSNESIINILGSLLIIFWSLLTLYASSYLNKKLNEKEIY